MVLFAPAALWSYYSSNILLLNADCHTLPHVFGEQRKQSSNAKQVNTIRSRTKEDGGEGHWSFRLYGFFHNSDIPYITFFFFHLEKLHRQFSCNRILVALEYCYRFLQLHSVTFALLLYLLKHFKVWTCPLPTVNETKLLGSHGTLFE